MLKIFAVLIVVPLFIYFLGYTFYYLFLGELARGICGVIALILLSIMAHNIND